MNLEFEEEPITWWSEVFNFRTATLAWIAFLVLGLWTHYGIPEMTGITWKISQLSPYVWLIPPVVMLYISIFLRKFRLFWPNLACLFVVILFILRPVFGSGEGNKNSYRIMELRTSSLSMGAHAIATAVRKRRPDFFVLTEIYDFRMEVSEERDLRQKLKGYSLVSSGDIIVGGRFPIAKKEYVQIPGLPSKRSLVLVTFEVKGELITVAGFHSKPAENAGNFKGAEIEKAARTIVSNLPKNEPLLIAGALESAPVGQCYRAFASQFQDAARAAGSGMMFSTPTRLPMNRLNYVFVSKDFQVLSAQVGNERLSGHFPLVVDVALPSRAKKPN